MTDYRPPDLAPEDVAALLAEVPGRVEHPKRLPAREFYTVQWAQAMRPGELRTVTWQDIDLRKRRLTVNPSNDKARTGRTVGLASEAYRILSTMAKLPHVPTAFVFGAGDYRRSLALAAARAKLPKVTAHHLRHARLSELASVTRDVAAVQHFAGHRHLATTDRYVRSRTERTELMLRDLARAKKPKKKPAAQQKSAARRVN